LLINSNHFFFLEVVFFLVIFFFFLGGLPTLDPYVPLPYGIVNIFKVLFFYAFVYHLSSTALGFLPLGDFFLPTAL